MPNRTASSGTQNSLLACWPSHVSWYVPARPILVPSLISSQTRYILSPDVEKDFELIGIETKFDHGDLFHWTFNVLGSALAVGDPWAIEVKSAWDEWICRVRRTRTPPVNQPAREVANAAAARLNALLFDQLNGKTVTHLPASGAIAAVLSRQAAILNIEPVLSIETALRPGEPFLLEVPDSSPPVLHPDPPKRSTASALEESMQSLAVSGSAVAVTGSLSVAPSHPALPHPSLSAPPPLEAAPPPHAVEASATPSASSEAVSGTGSSGSRSAILPVLRSRNTKTRTILVSPTLEVIPGDAPAESQPIAAAKPTRRSTRKK